jgi:hypothetical protein
MSEQIPNPNFSEHNAAALATLNEKVDSLANSIGKLAEVVGEERRNNLENTRRIYNEITAMRDRVAGAGRITWPLLVTTFSAALAFAAIVGGLGSYALQSETGRLNTRVDAVEDKAKATADKIENDRHADVEAARQVAKLEEWQRLMEPHLKTITAPRTN